MKSEKTANNNWRFGRIYQLGAIKRAIIIWLSFQGLLWLVFGISYLTHRDA